MTEANRHGDAEIWGSKDSIGDVNGESSDVESDSDSDSEEEEFHWDGDEGMELDEDTLLLIKRNDPIISTIDVHDFDHSIDGEGAGHIIGQSPHLKKLLIKGESMLWEEDFKRTSLLLGKFCKGLAQNRSIEHMMIRCCDLSVGDVSVTDPMMKKLQLFNIMRMTQFVQQNNNLQTLKIECCDLGNKSTRVLGLVLGRKGNKGSLQRINLYSNEIDDAAAQELIESLQGYDNLVELSLAHNQVGAKGCAALENLVSSPTSKLKEINLENNQIDDEGIAILTRAFSENARLKWANLGNNLKVTDAGWQQFFTCFENSLSSIEQLDLGANRITDQGIISLGNALMNNTTLMGLDFNPRGLTMGQQHVTITADGWRSFFARIQGSKSVLQDILLRDLNIDEDGLVVLADAVSKNSRFKVLDLGKNPRITAGAWRHFFARCLQAPNSSLEGLYLCDNLRDEADELMGDLARAIALNDKLEAIDLGENPSISNAGWSHLSHLLCDKSSIASIYESNHTVNYFGPQRLPLDLDDLVKINEHENKKDVAREKILQYHFQNGANVQEFLDLKLKVLPHAISWLGRDCFWTGRKDSGRTPLYQLLRSLPSLFEPRYISRGTKRKRC